MTRRIAVHLLAMASALQFVAPYSAAQLTLQPRSATFWIGSSAAIVASLALDEELRRAALANQSLSIDRLSRDLNPLGQAHNLLPALALAYAAPRLTGHRTIADAALRIALGYLVADGIESALKPLVGRHRPDPAGGGDLRFRPLTKEEAWHSFPSGHTVHAFSIAAGIAAETRQPWLAATAYAVAGAVGLQRIYAGAHWASDVTASAVLAILASSTTVHWLRICGLGPVLAPAGGQAAKFRCAMRVTPRAVSVEARF